MIGPPSTTPWIWMPIDLCLDNIILVFRELLTDFCDVMCCVAFSGQINRVACKAWAEFS
jgi:hypothetical protein